MIREAIIHITSGATLSEDEAATVMEEIMTGVATQAQMGAFLTALRLRAGGETIQEIAGLARIMREKAVQVHLAEPVAAHALDTCGTGTGSPPRYPEDPRRRLSRDLQHPQGPR